MTEISCEAMFELLADVAASYGYLLLVDDSGRLELLPM